ncbi:uncharacterized protein LOC124362903 isoform X1 [Homalodisca vitripennis]|uniref:uncharacterized protein LOC124362903 isoform X1 n=1 Tax=Homalodisca vitripennis TaxID=197043 RepID=UPI001EEB71F2|nr:uncharacterized protein LOC124362903 isoform X1 [Homalodisca vitripennis]
MREAINSLSNIKNTSVFDTLRFNVEYPIFYPKQKQQTRRLNYTFTPQSAPFLERNSDKVHNFGAISTKNNKTSSDLEEQKNFPKISRSDRGYFDDFNVDYVKTNKEYKKGSNHFSIFHNPGFENSENDDGNTYSDEILLGGTNENHDGTTAFPIVDFDHNYSDEYDYLKQEGQISGESDEKQSDVTLENSQNYSSEDEKQDDVNEEGNTESVEENEEEENEEEEKEEHGETEEEEEEKEEDEDDDHNNGESPSAVSYEEDKGSVQPSFQFVANPEDIQDRYISKDPLAGPGATKGFNHDFTAIRGVPVLGNVVVQPTRYPTVPSFNTNQIHNIIKTGILPGSVGINGTLTGSGQVAPANPLPGQYLIEPRYPSSYGPGTFSRRPVSIRTKTNYYLGRGRRPSYSLGPKTQNTVSFNRYPRIRKPIRGGTPLSYHPSGRSIVRIFKHTVTGRLPTFRVNLLEERTSNEGPRSPDIGYENLYREKEIEHDNLTSSRPEKDLLQRIDKYDYSSLHDRAEDTVKSNDNSGRNILEEKEYNIDNNTDTISLLRNDRFYNSSEKLDLKRPLKMQNNSRMNNTVKLALHSANNTHETISSTVGKNNQNSNSRHDKIVSESKVNNLKGISEQELKEENNKNEEPRDERERVVSDEYEEEPNENSEEFGKRYPVKDMSDEERKLPLSKMQNKGGVTAETKRLGARDGELGESGLCNSR